MVIFKYSLYRLGGFKVQNGSGANSINSAEYLQCERFLLLISNWNQILHFLSSFGS